MPPGGSISSVDQAEPRGPGIGNILQKSHSLRLRKPAPHFHSLVPSCKKNTVYTDHGSEHLLFSDVAFLRRILKEPKGIDSGPINYLSNYTELDCVLFLIFFILNFLLK